MLSLTGGSALEAKLKEIGAKATSAASVQVGFLAGATEPDGTSIPMIAAIQEFGAPRAGIPPRPFFRNMIAAKSGEWGDAVAGLLEANDYDAAITLGQMGEGISGQLKQAIVDTVSPPLSEVTLMLRQIRREDPDLVVTGKTVGEAAERVARGEKASGVSTKPLVDSGNLLNSVGYFVSSGTDAERSHAAGIDAVARALGGGE